MDEVFRNEDVKRREPTASLPASSYAYQKVFKENLVGSQIDNSQACAFPPSSAKLGVDGRSDCLQSE
jgi:hypothetical protein